MARDQGEIIDELRETVLKAIQLAYRDLGLAGVSRDDRIEMVGEAALHVVQDGDYAGTPSA